MSRTLFVTDLDGTLLLPNGRLGDHTRTVLGELAERGVLFTYATARSFQSAGPIMRGTEISLPVITYGGAITVDPRTGTAATAVTIPVSAVQLVLRELERHGVAPLVFVVHEGRDRVCWLGQDASVGIRDFLSRRPGDPRLLELRSWAEIDLSAVFYISAIGYDRPLLAGIDAELGDDGIRQACHVILGEDVYAAGQFWLEFTEAGATKAAAIRALAARVGADRIVCFGDNLNDLPMFAVAHESYPVANAVPPVRAAATAVIASNADEGVASWLSAATQAMPTPGSERGRT